MAKKSASSSPASHPAHPQPDLPQATWDAIRAAIATTPSPGFVAASKACRAARCDGRIQNCSNQQLDAALKYLADQGELGATAAADDSTPESTPAPGSDPLKIHINRFLDVVYDEQAGRARVYVGGKPFLHCSFIVANIPIGNDVDDGTAANNRNGFTNQINSIDDLATSLEHDARVLEGPDVRRYLTPAEEVLAHASNLQAWVENDYDTRLLHSNIAFSLLKELAKNGDDIASRVLSSEIETRLCEGNQDIREIIIHELCDRITEKQWILLAGQPDAKSRLLVARYAIFSPLVLESLERATHLAIENVPTSSPQYLENKSVSDTIEQRRLKKCMDRMPIITINNPFATYICGNRNVLDGRLTIEMYSSEYDDDTILLDFDTQIDFRGNEDLIQSIEVINHRNEYGDARKYPDLYVRFSSLSRFTNLKTLKMPYCGLTSLPDLTGCQALEHIEISCNHLESVEQLAGAVNLVKIDASRNYIHSLRGIENLTQLTRIDFTDNELTSMKEVEGLSNLVDLILGCNHIKEIEGLAHLDKLSYLDLSINEISVIDKAIISILNKIVYHLRSIELINNPIVDDKAFIDFFVETLEKLNPKARIEAFNNGRGRDYW